MLQRKYDLVLFDLDGVILDSRENMRKAWEAVMAEHDVSVPFEPYFNEIGRAFAEILARLGLAHKATGIEATFRRESAAHLAATPFFDGIEAVLHDIAVSPIKTGIITSKDALRTQLALERLADGFDIVLSPRPDLRGKPAPDPLLYAMAKQNTDPSRTLYIGDMETDHEAATRAGVDYAHVAWGYGAPAGPNHHLLNEPADIAELI